MLKFLLNRLKAYDEYTYKHSKNVAEMAKEFSFLLNLVSDSNIDLKLIETCGLLHDIGKIFVDIDIINKESKLSDKEFEFVKQHPTFGIEYIKMLNISIPREVLLSIEFHHKGYNYNGYPSKEIDLSIEEKTYVDIITICDIFDALTSKRSYKEGLSLSKTFAIMNDMSGNQINPVIYQDFKDYIISKNNKEYLVV